MEDPELGIVERVRHRALHFLGRHRAERGHEAGENVADRQALHRKAEEDGERYGQRRRDVGDPESLRRRRPVEPGDREAEQEDEAGDGHDGHREHQATKVCLGANHPPDQEQRRARGDEKPSCADDCREHIARIR